ncbi:SusC/RagA family TonB-linked outer membrane protein [Pedobacter antarcticus]|uniref:SusC/RagA family TonB-linked outer membrane protein n=1 Tax=Pedobacter antarcticus TaxID=34086 RepID=UPI001C59A1D1|nr:TonB-dependent receptor [Pedobacter antarcticus]
MKKIRYLLILLLIFPLLVSAQQGVTISGRVFDASGKATLPGVSVKVKGTSVGTVTDSEGKFSLYVPNPEASIQISSIGFIRQEIPVKSRKDFQILLVEDSQVLQDLVVVGYGTQKKETVTGSVSTIKSQDIVVTKNESVVNMLTGKIAGVRVLQKTAEPGGYANNLNIRGFKSDPLIVIDGVIGGDQATLGRMDPNEIENISILKDAAASIYGIRAAGGVILVTTKKGDRSGKFDINYSVNRSFQTFLGMPEGVGAVDYMLLSNEQRKHDFNNNFLGNQAPAFSYNDIKPWLDGTRKSADWIGEAFNKSAGQVQHNLNVNGGNEKITYFFNLGYQEQDGVFKSGDLNYNKYNFRSNVTVDITKGLKAQILTSGMMDQKNQPYTDLWTIYKYTWNQIPIDQLYANDNPLYPSVIRDNMNPAVVTNSDIVGSKRFERKNFTGQLNLQYDIPGIKGLSAKALYSLDYTVDDNNEHRKEYTLYNYKADDDSYLPSKVQSPSRIRRSYYSRFNTLSSVSLNYANTFFNDHNLSATLVYEQSHQKGDNFYAQRDTQIPVDYLFGGLANSQMLGGMDINGLNDLGFRSIIGRVSYDYKGKYLGEFSFRRDGSNKYQPGTSDQYGFFPAVSVGWVLTKEDFFRNLIPEDILTSLKFRASYGQTGDERGRAFNYVSGFNYPVDSYIFGGDAVNGSTQRLGNPGLSWAVNTKKNIAVDFSLLGGKIDGTFEVFRSDRTGLEAKPTEALPGTVGADVPEINYNSDRVQGLDFTLSHRNKIGNVGINVSGNIGTTRAQWLNYLQGRAGNEYENWKNSQANRYQNIWWGPTYGGQFNNYNQIYNHPVNMGGGNNSTVPGDYFYEDWNGDGEINGKDDHPIATNDSPLINFGASIGLTYKNFDMNVLLQGATGVYVQYGEQFANPLMYGGSALTRFLDSWHTLDPNANIYDPNTQWASGFYPAMGSPAAKGTKAIQNASYLRIKTLEFGYSLPAGTLKKVGVKKLRVFVNSYNLATFTGLKNYDPEHQGPKSQDEIDNHFEVSLGGYTYPMNRTFNIGANVSF